MSDFFSVSVKTLTRTGMYLHGQARRLGSRVSSAESQSGHLILDGYILRAVRTLQSYNVFIIDTPSMLLLSGGGIDLRDEVVSVGQRDDFTEIPEGSDLPSTTYSARTENSVKRIILPTPAYQPTSQEAMQSPAVLIGMMPPQEMAGGLRTAGYRRVPMRMSSQFYQMDDLERFTFSQNCGVGISLTLARSSMTELVSPQVVRGNYMSHNSFWVMESDLDSGWSMQPRRLVAFTNYSGTSPYLNRVMPRSLSVGGCVIPAENDGIDRYCIAFEAVKQNRNTWTGPIGNYFDRQGEHSLVICKGQIDRADYEQSPIQAGLVSSRYIRAGDIPLAEIQPFPATYQGFGEGPTLTTCAWFHAPAVTRATNGFVTFFLYVAPNYREQSDIEDTDVSWGVENIAMSNALAAVTADGSVHVLKADRNDLNYDAPGYSPIPGADTEKMVHPWIVGTDSVLRTVDGVSQRTAYALVWEEWTRRGPNSGDGSGVEGDRLKLPSNTLGGELVLYRVGSGAPERTALGGDKYAAVFHPNMYFHWVFPIAATYAPPGSTRNYWYSPDTTYGAAYYAGDEKLVTAVIPNEVFHLYQPLEPTSQLPLSGPSVVDLHNVSCAFIDLSTNSIEVRGVIAPRTFADRFCIITVAQQAVAETDSRPAKPAILLATMRTAIRSNLFPPPSDETFLSIDGGWNWRLYVEDAAGTNGTFLVGNQMWSNAPEVRIGSQPSSNQGS